MSGLLIALASAALAQGLPASAAPSVAPSVAPSGAPSAAPSSVPATGSVLAWPPWADASAGGKALRAWRPVGLPPGKAPMGRFGPAEVDGQTVLALQAQASYGTLVHDLPAGTAAGHLAWRWRLREPNPRADLRERSGDDAALKVCASFDLPIEAVPFVERQVLRLARRVSGEDLPAATLCYVWDARLAPDTALDNAYSRRMRWLVLRGPQSPLDTWLDERRDLRADFLRLFGDEARRVPPLRAIVIGADADNTGGSSLGFLDRIRLD